MKTIVVTGPESTGKTSISEYLSKHMHCPWIPEYAREYVSRLNRPYNYEDLVKITETQVKQITDAELSGTRMIILDTWLIITKVWFLEVFGTFPSGLDREIMKHKIDLFLICRPDIPWVPDPLRENGGERREYLMNRYIEEIIKTGYNYEFVSGTGSVRFANALNAVKLHINI